MFVCEFSDYKVDTVGSHYESVDLCDEENEMRERERERERERTMVKCSEIWMSRRRR